MANLFDYLEWRGDIPFSVDPFNEVDNLVLAELAYVDFAGIVPEPWADGETGMDRGRIHVKPDESVKFFTAENAPRISITEVCEQFWQCHTAEEIEKSGTLFKKAPFLLKKLCSGSRFGNMQLSMYVDYVSAKKSEQISAVTCFLDDGTAYAAFRGTDDTLVGWKEDFSLSFMKETEGQKSAVHYLDRHFAGGTMPLRVGGHSKGGNFAVYASAFCSEDIKRRILTVYSNDGPGFHEEIVQSESYQEMIPKLRGFVPEESVFGLLLEHEYLPDVVKSSAKGVWQHDALSWKVMRNEFEKSQAVSEGSLMIEKTLESWVNGLAVEERKEVVDIVFETLDESGMENLSEITADQFKSIPILLRAYRDMNAEDRRFLRMVAGKLLMSGARLLSEEIQGMVTRKLKDLNLS